MNNTVRIKYFCYFIFCVLLVGIQVSFANETFQNNLLKADVHKNSLGAVKVTLYTSKPYNDAVVVNKKSDNEYVILLPETANSLTSKPSINSASDVVKNIVVKTQQYNGGIKGYTKMIISTNKPVEITPQVQTLNTSSYELREKDYSELMSQTVKKQAMTPKTDVKQAPSIVAAKKENAKSEKRIKVASEQSVKTVLPSKTIQKIKSAMESKTISRKEVAVKNISTAKKIKEQKIARESKPEVLKNIETQTPTITPNELAQNIESNTHTAEVFQKITTQPATNIEISKPLMPVAPKITTPPATSSGHFWKYKLIVKKNIYEVCGLILAIFLLLLLIARKMTKNIQKQKENFVNQLGEQPIKVTDYSEKISDDMTWKEKFQTYVDTSSNSNMNESNTEEIFVQPNEAIDDLFAHEDKLQERGEETVDEILENIVPDVEETYTSDDIDEIIKSESMPSRFANAQEEVSIEDLLGEDEENIIEEGITPMASAGFVENENIENLTDFSQQDIPFYGQYNEFNANVSPKDEASYDTEASTELKAEYIIDDGKGFYLVDIGDSSALVGHINDEIFVLKRFDEKIDAPLQARIDEKKGTSAKYMTKVGKFKGLVEVTPANMNLLIEL